MAGRCSWKRSICKSNAASGSGLLGRNGMGKSTLLKLVNGDLSPESGVVARQQNLRVAYLPQEVPQGLAGTVAEIVASGLDAERGS